VDEVSDEVRFAVCLTITVELADASEEELGPLARALSTPDLDFDTQGPGFLRRHAPRLALHACGLLAEDADWDAATWSMTKEGSAGLSAAFGRLFQATSGEVRIAALWEGDQAETERAISQQEMVKIAAEGELSTKTRYVIAR
jgi:hypothetical protein